MNVLKLEGACAQMRKISINVLNKDADNTLFTLPLEGIELSREQLDAYLGERTFEAFYEQRRDGSYHPMPYFSLRKDGSFEIDDEFNCDSVTLALSGSKSIEFETEEAADDGDEEGGDRPAAKIHSLKFTPTAGGITKLSFHMQVRPGIGKDNLALQEHMFRTVRVTLGELTRVERKGKQEDLPLGDGGAPPERAVSGGFTQGRSAEEIDAQMRRRHPQTPVMGDDSQAFADGAAAQVAAFNAKPGEVVDGRSERVKHQDRQRNGGGSRSRHR